MSDGFAESDKVMPGETEKHITPIERVNQNVPTGEWVDVPEGMMAAPGCYVDEEGTLRQQSNDSCVVWHLKTCDKKGIQKEEIVYDPETNAPWCPDCWNTKRLQNLFGTTGSKLSLTPDPNSSKIGNVN